MNYIPANPEASENIFGELSEYGYDVPGNAEMEGRQKEILMIRRGLGRFAELVGKAENDRVGK